MQPRPDDELRRAISLADNAARIDNQTALRMKRELAERFREQLTVGAPTAADEAGLRRLARDQDACAKLAAWFEVRWGDRWCIDITKELARIIEESWAREPRQRPTTST